MNDSNDHDDLGRRLGEQLRSITADLEPGTVRATATAHHRSVRPPWVTAAAAGLVAATVVALVAWTGHGPSGERVAAVPSAAPSAAAPDSTPAASDTSAPAPTTSVPPASRDAVNILVVGLDGRCAYPADPAADTGSRSDTILVLRVEPQLRRAEMLSFQRDLWVSIAGTDRNSRLNSAMVRDDPTKLIYTLMENFGVPVDHFVQVDFCSTVDIVDAIGGIDVPFEHPVRDRNTGFEAVAGCVRLDGADALAYLRSRRLEVLGDDGSWQMDPRSDLSRIDRQQDFVRRLVQASLDRGLTDPLVFRELVSSVQQDVVVDAGLTIDRMLELGRAVADLDGPIVGYQLPASGRTISGNAVLMPDLDDPAAQAMLATFGNTSPQVPTTDSVAPAPSVAEDGRIVPDPAVTCPG